MERDLEGWIEHQLRAYHEAAHVIVAIELGREVFDSTLDDGSGFGFTNVAMEAHDPLGGPLAARSAALRDALYLLAGGAADERLSRAPRRHHHDAGTDIELATQRIAVVTSTRHAQHSSIEFLRRCALRMMNRPDVFMRVRHVADALLKRGVLRGEDVLRILSAADRQSHTAPWPPLLPRRDAVIHPRSPRLVIVGWRSGPPVLPRRLSPLPPRINRVASQAREGSGHAVQSEQSTSLPRTAREKRMHFVAAFAPVAFSGEALGAFRRGGISSLQELLERSESDLLAIRAVGKVLARQIRETLELAGFRLRTERSGSDDGGSASSNS